MVNYYNLLGVNQEASENEIRRKLKERKRIWTQRQNAPKPEQQQEASNNLRLVPDIEATLLNTQKRNEYDQKLKTLPEEEEEFEPRTESEPVMVLSKRTVIRDSVSSLRLQICNWYEKVTGRPPDYGTIYLVLW